MTSSLTAEIFLCVGMKPKKKLRDLKSIKGLKIRLKPKIQLLKSCINNCSLEFQQPGRYLISFQTNMD